MVPALWMIPHELRDDRRDLCIGHTSNAVSECSDLLPVVPSARSTKQRSEQHPIYNTHRVITLALIVHMCELFRSQESVFNRDPLLRETEEGEQREEHKNGPFHLFLRRLLRGKLAVRTLFSR